MLATYNLRKITIRSLFTSVTALALAAFAVVLGEIRVAAQSTDLVVGPVNTNESTVLQGHHPTWAKPETDAGLVPPSLRLEHLTLLLSRSPEQELEFKQFLERQQDPTSSDYHHWLTAAQIGERFGVSLHDIAAISDWLRSQDLRLDYVSPSRVRINFSGTASAVSKAFGAEMHYFNVQGKNRISITTEPRIPAALAPVIKVVQGLYTVEFQPMYKISEQPGRIVKPGPGSQNTNPQFTISSTQHLIVPGDFAVIYDVNPAYQANIFGLGLNIAIIGRSRVSNADIENFQSLMQLPVQDPVVIVPPTGVDPGPAATGAQGSGALTGDQEEQTLDVTRSGSVAPGATVELVISGNSATADGVDIATQYAIDAIPAAIMSISYGSCEAHAGPANVQFFDGVFSQAAAEGISVFVSSGDSAAAGCDPAFQTPPATQVASPNSLCSSGYVTCVGGSEFADTANPAQYWSSTNAADMHSALSYIPEGAWNEPSGSSGTVVAGTGGGVSSIIPTPSWQTGTGVPAARAGRYTPDVAFSAAGHDGYFACLAAASADCSIGQFTAFAGTSAAAPDMAGIAALLAQKVGTALGNLNPMLYKLAANPANAVFHDVTVASSGVVGCTVGTPSMCNNSTASATGLTGGLTGYLVGAGFDEATGLGSIDVNNLLGTWGTLPALGISTTNLSANVNPSFINTSVVFTATVTTGGTNAPTGFVTFLDGGNTLGKGTLNASAVATFTTSTLAAGSHVITTAYGGDGNNSGSISAPLTQQVLSSYPVPVSLTLSPSSANAGGSGFNLLVEGVDFFPTSTILWNGTARTTTYINSTSLQTALTPADIAAAGTASVTVKNPTPGGGTSNVLTFDVLEAFGGSGGFLSMFTNSGALGNSLLFQSNGFVGVGTTSPGAEFDVEYTTSTPTNALLSNINYNNTAAVNNAVVSAFDMNFLDSSKAANLSKQTARIAYIRQAGATGGVTAFDSALTATEFLFANAPYQVRGINIEGPTVDSGHTLANFTGLYIGSPGGAGTTTNRFALVTEPNAGNVGIGTTSPATALQVVGDVRIGNSGSNGCLQNFSGTSIAGTCSSDLRLKTNVLPFAPVLDKLVQIQPVHFNWKADEHPEYHFGTALNSGLIAQEVEKVFPEMVTVDARGYKMVNYSELPYLTLAAIRELKTENDSLRAQVTDKQQELEELHQQMSSIQARLDRLERRHSHHVTRSTKSRHR